MKILLVEDSATLRHAMRNYIIEAGHEPLIARSGEEALQMLENTPVDMIIMDVEMPGLNGFETTRLIREWLGGHWIPIIFVTGLNEDESYREGIEAGGDDYLIKPVSFMIIKAKIRAMERIAEMRDQLNQLNTELEALSQLDSLTQIYNRRTFNDLAEQQWALAKRHQLPISALMIDVDHFKLFNDHYGHPAGDSCLKKISQAIKSCLHRSADLFGRYGGEEFIVLLPETDTQGALHVAQSINQAIEALNLRHDVSPSSHLVTASIGGATCVRTTGHSLEELIKSADRALYKVKRSGRNRALIDEVVTHKTLLIADETGENSRHFSSLLQQHFNILHCDSPEECLELALELRPDMILIDTGMASAASHLLCLSLAEHQRTGGIPLAIMADPAAIPTYPQDNPWGIRLVLDRQQSGPTILNKISQLIG
ncbi:GGDEF domain-containing response regulator [Cellvibrio japonicus]|nr:diguanylate cyclase [Cellvibrio japonicus]QEI12820.1 diguanylate cyclase [Cellvibrio japonicus]QEI16394.1 diguanylate cyclase [Cellvibrio japonicus]QEI19972.1 diguanylate cyclase [Cellvibrio japonicus]